MVVIKKYIIKLKAAVLKLLSKLNNFKKLYLSYLHKDLSFILHSF